MSEGRNNSPAGWKSRFAESADRLPYAFYVAFSVCGVFLLVGAAAQIPYLSGRPHDPVLTLVLGASLIGALAMALGIILYRAKRSHRDRAKHSRPE